MHHIRKHRLLVILTSVVFGSIIVSLVLFALRQNISLFYTPKQLAKAKIPPKQLIRVGGMVVKGSLRHSAKGKIVQFAITDLDSTVYVRYRGLLPDLFREGQGVVVNGYLVNNLIRAQEVLAKHDEKYMPPEIRHLKEARV
ncbi:MAG: cytochrome c biogenesis protein CcmE [Legionellales bacterium RIFCSPHIGHO2_12_FULL_37_14]|nr:MAG: cytochrome c biogenesis protein CcmE [Legionellales bacterium RIFCSPHIGHO2_12_FULL_37_14]